MIISVGTFNLNNLFSRYNFEAPVATLPKKKAVTVEYTFDRDDVRYRSFKGRLIKQKDPADTDKIAHRIKDMQVDVLAVQEVEDIDTLREFNKTHLNNYFDHQVLVEGNDPRFIDVGVLSTLPLRALTSYQTERNPPGAGDPVFSRDLLQVEVWDLGRTRKLFTLFNNHLKSHFVDPRDDPDEGTRDNNERRRRQAETIAEILTTRLRRSDPYIVVGDMNDAPATRYLAPLVQDAGLGLVNALESPQETRPTKPERSGYKPRSRSWTHRFPVAGTHAEYRLFDHIWLSPSLAPALREAWIDRRKNLTGDGSDHDPAWVKLEL